jgi:tetratricopeptide (TPR) repeat protein
MFRQTVLVTAGLLCVAAAPLLADEAEDAFNQLYGDDLRHVLATPAPADDIALARQLLDAAQKAEKQPAFLAVLCEKAYDLAAKNASGYPTATAAMDLLAEKVPEKKVEALQKTAALHQKQYATARADAKTKAGEALLQALSTLAAAQAEAGDIDAAKASLKQALTIATAIKSDAKAALQAQLDGLAPQQKMEKQIAALKARLEKNPEDAASRKELLRLLLEEEDNPAEAAKFLDESLDDATRKYVPAAARPMEEAPELACKELGDWYRGLADGAATPASKGAMLCRAQGYYERFLDLHKDEDLARTTATLMLKKIEDALAKLPAPKVAAVAWVDCLKLVDPAKHAIQGHWERKDGHLVLVPTGRGAHLTIPAAPSGNYDLQATFVRKADGDVGFFLPVGVRQVHLNLSGSFGQWSGLEPIEGKGGMDNMTTVRPGTLVNGHEYTIDIKVRVVADAAAVEVRLDDKPYIQWQGALSALSARAHGQHNCLGLNAWETTAVEFRRLRVRMLSGELKTPDGAPAKLTTAWTDCLKLVDPARDAVKGKWELRNGQLFSTERGGQCHLSLPIVLKQSYEVQATVARTAGDDALILGLPAGKGACTLTLSDDRGAWHRLELIDGKRLDVRSGTLVSGQEYVVGVKVFLRGEDAEIAATLDGKPLLQWKGRQASLSTHPNWASPDPRCLGVGTWLAEAVFRRIRVRALPDDARSAAEAPAPKPKG